MEPRHKLHHCLFEKKLHTIASENSLMEHTAQHEDGKQCGAIVDNPALLARMAAGILLAIIEQMLSPQLICILHTQLA